MATKNGGPGRLPGPLEQCVDAAEDVIAQVNEMRHLLVGLQRDQRRFAAMTDAADAELERVLTAALMLRAYPVALRALPSGTPTREQVARIARANRSGLAADTDQAA